ncbi:MAG: Ty1/Copia family ribonuclease HI, partial [Planctomycetia bacterium]|nr:Ty1/Copia family ribonuclease HI [Planctomycetia bacterium]
YYAAIDLLLYVSNSALVLHFPGTSKAPSGIDPSLGESIRASGGLVAFSDSTWRRPDRHGFNMFGFVVFFMGAPISFTSKQLKVVALSSAEAEYAAASYACREISFIRHVLLDLGFNLTYPTILCVDNRAAIEIAHNLGVTSRNKHFVDAIHYFRHLVDHRVVIPTHVASQFQRADGFTKCLGKSPFKAWLRLLLPSDCFNDV